MIYLVKPIERAGRFEHDSFIVFSADDFPHLTSEREEHIEFKFKTTENYGVWFIFELVYL